MSVAENIKQARKAVGMSQDELAEHIGANRVTISKYENGLTEPNIDMLRKLSVIFNVSIDDLING